MYTLLLMPQDKYHLYLLFDLMSGGDLMDVLVAEARVIRRRIAQGAWRRACLAPKARPCTAWAWCMRSSRIGFSCRPGALRHRRISTVH